MKLKRLLLPEEPIKKRDISPNNDRRRSNNRNFVLSKIPRHIYEKYKKITKIPKNKIYQEPIIYKISHVHIFSYEGISQTIQKFNSRNQDILRYGVL